MLHDLVLQGGGSRVSVHNQVRPPKKVIRNLRAPQIEEDYNEFVLIAKISKLKISKYDGSSDPLYWIYQLEQYFEVHCVYEKRMFNCGTN